MSYENTTQMVPLTEQAPDIAAVRAEQAPVMATLSAEHAAELGTALSERLKDMDYSHATEQGSVDSMVAASLTTDLLTEALSADPSGVDAVKKYGGPIDKMTHFAKLMHTHHTGSAPAELKISTESADLPRILKALQAVKQRAEDRNGDGTAQGKADAFTAVSRRSIAEQAVFGLRLLAEQNDGGRVIVSQATAKKVIDYLSHR